MEQSTIAMLGIANFTNSQVSWLNSFHVVALETQNDSAG